MEKVIPTTFPNTVSYSNRVEVSGNDFVKYLLDLKMTQALALIRGDKEKASTIGSWFDSLRQLLKEMFDDPSAELVFDEDSFRFSLTMEGRDPFDFNTLSSGYAALFDIVLDLIVRMKSVSPRRFDFLTQGVVEGYFEADLQSDVLRAKFEPHKH